MRGQPAAEQLPVPRESTAKCHRSQQGSKTNKLKKKKNRLNYAESLHGKYRGRSGRESQVNDFGCWLCCWGYRGRAKRKRFPRHLGTACSWHLDTGANGAAVTLLLAGESGSGKGLPLPAQKDSMWNSCALFFLRTKSANSNCIALCK